MLLSRDYPGSLINAAISRALEIPRQEALKKVIKEKSSGRAIFVITYNPQLPSIQKILNKHWRVMINNDPHLKDVFPAPPLVAFRKPKTIGDKIIRSKVAKAPTRTKRENKGMKKCLSCPICPFIQEGKLVKSSKTDAHVEINFAVNCQTSNIIYCITCTKCTDQYIGQSERTLQKRFSEHRDYVKHEKVEQATGWHFNKKGHGLHHMRVTILEKVHSSDEFIRLERESMFIKQFNTKYKGINKSL